MKQPEHPQGVRIAPTVTIIPTAIGEEIARLVEEKGYDTEVLIEFARFVGRCVINEGYTSPAEQKKQREGSL